ncbi:MAG: hypothetical protein GTN38_00065 [Candidatus Aenigmarchaeota archaeon]|nr:hypothetical protein [Candidatus Aenigmarchaeota archaeon]NIP39899.1 hypothetical protein [Candidatus Aenigmarchaeota archaeon]NIQ17618.1 hypothetical protein [Candidatus Aenigmarchaeota archaeon]NIS72806.1 hypothetical protein [Candidatus Aenigmarchaeota archaeon]
MAKRYRERTYQFILSDKTLEYLGSNIPFLGDKLLNSYYNYLGLEYELRRMNPDLEDVSLKRETFKDRKRKRTTEGKKLVITVRHRIHGRGGNKPKFDFSILRPYVIP